MSKMKTVSVLLPEETVEALRKLAFEDRMVISSYVRHLLKEYVKNHANKLVGVPKQIEQTEKKVKQDIEEWDTEIEVYDPTTGETRRVRDA